MAENKVRNLEQVQAFEQQKAAFDPHLAEMDQLKDSDYAEEQMVNKGKAVLKDHFAEHQDKLAQARDKLTRLKRKMVRLGNAGKVSGDGKTLKKSNEMKGKTLGERLLIGGNFQVQPGEKVALDMSPQLAYRLTKYLNIGLGGTYRTSFDEKEKFWLSDEQESFGYRAFLEHDVIKGLFFHGEYERLRQPGKANDMEKSIWHKGALLGVGKHYKIRNKIKGNVMLLYNFLYDVDGPYPKAWNIRFGFEIIRKKKDKKETTKNEDKK